MRQCSLNTVGHGGVKVWAARIPRITSTVYTQRCSLLQSLDGLPNQSPRNHEMNESLGCNGRPFPLRRRTDRWGCALVPLCPCALVPAGGPRLRCVRTVPHCSLFTNWRHGTGPRSLVCGDEADDYDDLAELQREAQGVHLSTALYLSGTA